MLKSEKLEKSSSAFQSSLHCVYCHELFKPGDIIVSCPRDETIHHAQCWSQNNNRCAIHLCNHSESIAPLQYSVVLSARTYAFFLVFIIVGVIALTSLFFPRLESVIEITEANAPVPKAVRDQGLVTLWLDLDDYGELTLIRLSWEGTFEQREVCNVLFRNTHPGELQLKCSIKLPAGAADIAWSEEGSTLVFSSSDATESTFQLYKVETNNGLRAMPLTPPDLMARRPSWRPNEFDEIVFQARGKDEVEFQIGLVRSDGTNLRRLIATTGNSIWPSWSPNGEVLLFANDTVANTYQVYHYDTQEEKSLTKLSNAKVVSDDRDARCYSPIMPFEGTIAYICLRNGQNYLEIRTATKHQILIPSNLEPRGHLVWIPNNIGYVFACRDLVENLQLICFANHQKVSILPLPEDAEYLSPAWRPAAGLNK